MASEITLEQILQATISPNEQIRTQAEEYIKNMQDNKPYDFTKALLKIFLDKNQQNNLRFISGIILKNTYGANDITLQMKIDKRYFMMNSEQQNEFKNTFIDLYKTVSDENQCDIISSLISGIIMIEYRSNDYAYINNILNINISNRNMELAIFKIIENIFQGMKKEKFQNLINSRKIFEILTHQPNNETITEQLAAFTSALDLIDGNYIYFYGFLNSVLSQFSDLNVQNKIIDCCTSFTKKFYLKIDFNDKIVLSMIENLKNENIQMSVLEFFMSIADIAACNKNSVFYKLIVHHMNTIIPILLNNLKGEDDEEWTEYRASSCLMQKFAKLDERDLLENEIIYNLILNNITNEIGISVFGSAVYRKSSIPDFSNLINRVIESFNSAEKNIQEKIFWLLSRVVLFNQENLNEDIAISFIFQRAIDYTSISLSAAMIFRNICENKRPMKKLFYYYASTIAKLNSASEKISIQNYTLRMVLFATLNSAISICPDQYVRYLNDLLKHILKKINDALTVIPQTTEDKFLIIEDILSNYIELVQIILMRIGESNISLSLKEELKSVFLKILRINRPTLAKAEIYIALTFLCETEKYFLCNLNEFMECAINDLSSVMIDPLTYKAVVNFVGDSAINIQYGFLQYKEIIVVIIEGLRRKGDENLKPGIIAILADICLATGTSYVDILEPSISLIFEIFAMNRFANIVHIDNMRRSCLKLISAIVLQLNGEEIFLHNEKILLQNIYIFFTEDTRNFLLNDIMNCIIDFIKKRKITDQWIIDLIKRGSEYGDGELAYRLKYEYEEVFNK